MSVTINGFQFSQDARSFDVSETYATQSNALTGSTHPRVFSGGRDSRRLSFTVPVVQENPEVLVSQLKGMAEQSDVLLVEASDQTIVDDSSKVYVKRASVSEEPTPGAPTYVRVRFEAEIVGVPLFDGGNTNKALFLGGEFTPTEWDNVYFPLGDASRKGVTPTSTTPLQWERRSTNDWTDVRGSFPMQRYNDGNWSVQGSDDSSENLSVYTGKTDYDDHCWQANVRFDTNVNGSVGLLYRLQGTSTTSNGYRVRFDSSGVTLERRTGDDSYTSVASHSMTPQSGQWYSLAVSGSSSRLRVYLDGDKVIDTSESTHTSGRVGIAYDGAGDDVYWRHMLASDATNPRITSTPLHNEAAVTTGTERADDYLPQGGNLLANPGFESNDVGDSTIDKWSQSGSPTVNTVSSPTILGQRAVEVTSDTGYLAQEQIVDRRNNYVVEVWTRQEDDAGTPKLELSPVDGDGDTLSTDAEDVTGLWQRLRVVLTPNNIKNTTKYEARLYPSGDELSSFKATFDFASFRRATPFVRVPDGSVIQFADTVAEVTAAPATSSPSINVGGVGKFSVSEATLDNE